MITLHGFGPGFGLVDGSPFVLKVDLLLRIAKLEYKVSNSASNLQKAPKGKLPFITDNDKTIADSYFIERYLKTNYDFDMDKSLSNTDKSLSKLLSKSLEENFYWCIVYSRWIKEDSWPVTKDMFFGKMPFPLRIIIPIIARRGVQKTIKMHGMGRHTENEILEITKDTLESLSTLLAEKAFFFGNEIRSFDVTVYAMLVQLVGVDIENNFSALAKTFPNLVDYCKRITTEYYPAI